MIEVFKEEQKITTVVKNELAEGKSTSSKVEITKDGINLQMQ